MTTKTYMIQEREKGEWIFQAEYETRKEALCTISDILSNDEDADPQNFKIVINEKVSEKGTLLEAASLIAKSLEIFGDKFEVKEFFSHSDGGGFIEMSKGGKYPLLGMIELRQIFTSIEAINGSLPEGYSVFFVISHDCSIRIMLSEPAKENKAKEDKA